MAAAAAATRDRLTSFPAAIYTTLITPQHTSLDAFSDDDSTFVDSLNHGSEFRGSPFEKYKKCSEGPVACLPAVPFRCSHSDLDSTVFQ